MTENILELEEFTANSFMGISSDKPVIIQFSNKKRNQNIVEFFGDETLGKTSTLCGILYAMGAKFNLDKNKLINSKDGKIDVNLKFKYEDESYHVIVDESRVVLKKLNEETGKWKPEDSPLNLLRKIFGPVGLSPFAIRELDGKKQIQFFQEMFGSGEDATKKMKVLEADIDKVFSDRRNVNREIKDLSGALKTESLYLDYEKTQARFKKPPSAKKEKEAFDALTEKNAEYNKAKDGVTRLAQDLKAKSNEVAELEQKLAAAKKSAADIEKRMEDGKKWLTTNKDVPAQYEAANNAWIGLSKTLTDHEKWKSILQKEKELHEREQLVIKATGQLDELREQLLKLTRFCIPKVEGLSIKVAAGIDKEDKPEGVFFNDQPIHELSESQYIRMWCLIFAAADVNFIFVENTSSLGSNAATTLNLLAKEGAIIFGTRMDRAIKAMGISFMSKL